MKPLWIVGGAGAALEVWAVQAALQEHGAGVSLAGFVTLDARPEFDPQGLAVMAEPDFLRSIAAGSVQVVLALGAPRIRQRAAETYARAGFDFATLVHPSAIVGPRVTLGEGSVVMAAAVLETHVAIGAHALVNVHSSLAHECRLGDYCSLGPGVHLAGRVTIGDRCDLGVGAVVRPGVSIASDVVIGAGAVVVGDCPVPGQWRGVPARQAG